MLKLTVVNRCLATLGESPLNSLDDSHAFLGTALDLLDQKSLEVQSPGRWFNTETLKLTPSPLDESLYLPGDVLEVNTGSAHIVQRGNRLYDLDKGTFRFTSPVTVLIIRNVDFEQLPAVAATYIAELTVHRFQAEYDGDQQKTALLGQAVGQAMREFGRAEVRNRNINMIHSHAGLTRLLWLTRNVRGSTR